MKSVRFNPWVGDQYASNHFYGKKILVLGESHYQWNEDKPIDNFVDITKYCISQQISGAETHAFWTHIAIAFLNHRPTLQEKHLFWHSVAFYNYIQCSVGVGARVRPDQKMWRDSEPGFVEVLKQLEPDIMVVLGYELWQRLPELAGSRGPTIVNAKQPDTWRYPTRQQGCLAYGIRHPSSGFNGRYWYPYIMQVIKLA